MSNLRLPRGSSMYYVLIQNVVGISTPFSSSRTFVNYLIVNMVSAVYRTLVLVTYYQQ